VFSATLVRRCHDVKAILSVTRNKKHNSLQPQTLNKTTA